MSYRYCYNHDVLCGEYNCNMADVVNNSVMCESKECAYNGGDYAEKHLVGMTKEEMFKLHSASLYGQSVYKILEESSKALTDYIHGKSDFSSAENGAKPLIDYVHENYCSNRDVATGNYDCPYATTVMNTICCTGHECNHKGIYEKSVVNNTIEDEDDECLSCPYFNPEEPDCCQYVPDGCYYDNDPDTYPF